MNTESPKQNIRGRFGTCKKACFFLLFPENMNSSLSGIENNSKVEDVDILSAGDKGFADIDIGKPEILIPNEFVRKYVNLNVH